MMTQDKNISDYPDNMHLSQLELFIRDKYDIHGDCPQDAHIQTFFEKFVKCSNNQIFLYRPDTKLPKLSKNLPPVVLKVINDAINRGVIANPYKHWGYFLPIFTHKESIDILASLNKKSNQSLEQFLYILLELPEKLAYTYAKIQTNEIIVTKQYLNAMELLLAETARCTDIITYDTAFTFTNPHDKLADKQSDIPVNKVDGDIHRMFFQMLGGYYMHLKEKLVEIEKTYPPLTPDENTLFVRTNSKMSVSTFWMSYMKDAFLKTFKRPNLKAIAYFAEALFGIKYSDGDVANLLRN